MAQSFRERIAEIAILKAIGFGDAVVMLLVLGEALLIVLLGGTLGLIFAATAIAVISEDLATNMPGLTFTVGILVEGVALMLLLGLLTGIVPAIQALRLNIVVALRRR